MTVLLRNHEKEADKGTGVRNVSVCGASYDVKFDQIKNKTIQYLVLPQK